MRNRAIADRVGEEEESKGKTEKDALLKTLQNASKLAALAITIKKSSKSARTKSPNN
jgi:hypothetical protein